uniref:Uncharacterized protein n=1 Tax=Rhizophagus irregularis (strain DAOM 181602 / DAOM 197198 / MUCL 43194) TaxID=747089 RepID=U9TE68_RHIID
MFSLSISSKAVTKMILLYKRSWEFLKRILRICENLECSLENEIIGSSLLRTLETLHHSQLNHNWGIYQQQFRLSKIINIAKNIVKFFNFYEPENGCKIFNFYARSLILCTYFTG